MSWLLRGLCFAFILPAVCAAEQQVTLKSGAMLIGRIEMNGDTMTVVIEDARIPVTFDQVASVTRVREDPSHAQRLLRIALESRLLRDSAKADPSLLAEAHRIDPDDPHIAFWYASALEAAGQGEAANAIAERYEQQFLAEYPGYAGELFRRIASRLKLKDLPRELVQRIDRLNAAAAASAASLSSDRIPAFAYFKLVDQQGNPVPKNAFRADSNGSNEQLQGFGNGYYLFTYGRYRSNNSLECKVYVSSIGYEAQTFVFDADSARVRDAGKFIAKKYTDDDLKPAEIRVVDKNGDALPEARVSLRLQAPYASANSTVNVTTDDEGIARSSLSPGKYSISASAGGYLPRSSQITVQGSDETASLKLSLLDMVKTKLRIAWVAESVNGDKAPAEGETDVFFVGGRPTHNDAYLSWLRVVQQTSGVGLMLANQRNPYGSPPGWVRLATPAQDQSARDLFASFDVEDVGLVRKSGLRPEQLTPPTASVRTQPQTVYKMKVGDVFAGEVTSQGNDYNQNYTVSFKILVESIE